MTARGTDPLHAWVLAIRPRTLTAAVAPVLVGTGLAAAYETLRPLPASAALLGALLIQVGTNLANDYHDYRRGSDDESRVGPLRVTQAGLLEPGAVRRGAGLAFALAMAVGVYLVAVGGWPVVVIGLASILAGVAYTAGPFPLAYNGLGDLFVFLFFGLVAVGGTYWVQALHFRWDLLVAGAAVGALTTAILVVNNLRDRETDERTGKRTLAVILGRAGSQAEYLLLLVLALVLPIYGVAAMGWSDWSLLALPALLLAIPAVSGVLTFYDPRELNGALAVTARATGLYAALLAVGLAMG